MEAWLIVPLVVVLLGGGLGLLSLALVMSAGPGLAQHGRRSRISPHLGRSPGRP